MSKNIFPILIVLGIIFIGIGGVYLMISNSGSTTSNLNVGQNTATNPTGAAAPQQSSPTPVPTIISSQTLESGLKIEEEKIGEGREVKSGDTIVIHYTGTLENGQKFDSSLDRNQPFETQIGVGKVIKGWDEGVIGMKAGGKRRLTIPPGLAYGEQGIQGAIPPNSTLIFELELLEIK